MWHISSFCYKTSPSKDFRKITFLYDTSIVFGSEQKYEESKFSQMHPWHVSKEDLFFARPGHAWNEKSWKWSCPGAAAGYIAAAAKYS